MALFRLIYAQGYNSTADSSIFKIVISQKDFEKFLLKIVDRTS